MDDYKQTMIDLILHYYSPTPEGSNIQMQTSQVLSWFKGIIPNQPITEHDVFDVLKEQSFKHSQKILTETIQTVKGNKLRGILPEYEEKEIGRILVWNLYERIADF